MLFVPVAYVLEVQSGSVIPGTNSMSHEGYPLVAGYAPVADTAIRGTRPKVYSVRTAEDVMTEGHYETQTMISGDAGNMTINGNTTVIDGELLAAAVADYQGGSIALRG